MSGKSLTHDSGESYSGVVPTKQPNKSEASLAEVVEGRPLTKENTRQPNPYRTPSRESGLSGLERVREAARRNRKLQFLQPYPSARFDATYPNIRGRNRVR
jgi:hypothetical protein